MAKYSIGDKVIHVKSQEKGIVTEVFPGGRGRQLYRVRYGDEGKDSLETNLIPDTDITDPYECCKRGLFGSYLDFSRMNTTFKIHNTSNNTISSLKASKTIFKAYQFKPLLKFLNSANRRLLIADEVGLGKTIEAGHIMMELAARKELRNVLIICPKMLQEKWKTELKEKFNFSFKIHNRRSLADELRSGDVVKGIVNYEAIRVNEKNDDESDFISKIETEQNIKFDLILCDEAHRLRNSGTKAYKGAERLMPLSASVVFLTATPIMISEENLYNLLHLLDKQQFDNREIFQTYLSINKPFIKAISQLNNNVSLKVIAEELRQAKLYIHYGEENIYEKRATVDEIFVDIPLYQKVISDLKSKPDTVDNRVQLQFDISSMSMMNNIFSRTRKSEVTTDWTQPVREPHTCRVKLNGDEWAEYNKVVDNYIKDKGGYDDNLLYGHYSQGLILGLIQKKRMIASSIYAYLNDEVDLNKGFDKYASCTDAKFDKLIEILQEVVSANKKKIIIFALFKNTLKYLSIRLKKSGYKSDVIHGDIDDRDTVIRRFKTDSAVNVLLLSEVGSEGIDLQFCDALVNYDLPWNPMVVEQRIGRIDRFGQKSGKVHIYNFIVKDSIQEEIYDRLLNRIGVFRSCIGDLEAILDKETETGKLRARFLQLENELYCQELSKEERKRKIDNIKSAILIEKRNLEQINEGLTDTLTNDTYFRNEIEKIQKNYRYITEQELYNYVQSLISNYLTECSLVNAGKETYKIQIPLSNKSYLTNFLHKYNSGNDTDTEQLFRQFINKIRDCSEFEVTFNQDVAYENQNMIFVNAYHPIIIAAKEHFRQNSQQVNTAFQFGLKKERFDDLPQIVCGEYFLAVYTIYFIKKWFGKEQNNELLIPIVFDVQSDTIIDDKDVSERFLGESQLYATINQMPYFVDTDLINILRVELADRIDVVNRELLKDQEMRMETSKTLQIQRMEEFYNNRIKIAEKTIEELEFKAEIFDGEKGKNAYRILPAQRARLKSLVTEKEDAIHKISESIISSKEPKLLSLSQIRIY